MFDTSIKILFEPRDLWIGVYWNYDEEESRAHGRYGILTVYVCLLPCLPLRFRTYRKCNVRTV
jgi:hypothetical protein